MAAVESESQFIAETVKGMYEKIEQKDKELEEVNENIKQAKNDQLELRATNNTLSERLDALSKQLELMHQKPSVRDEDQSDQTQRQGSPQQPWHSADTDLPQWTEVEPPDKPPAKGTPTPPPRPKPPRQATGLNKPYSASDSSQTKLNPQLSVIPDKPPPPPLPTSQPPSSVDPTARNTPRVPQWEHNAEAKTPEAKESPEPLVPPSSHTKEKYGSPTKTQHEGSTKHKPQEDEETQQRDNNKGPKFNDLVEGSPRKSQKNRASPDWAKKDQNGSVAKPSSNNDRTKKDREEEGVEWKEEKNKVWQTPTGQSSPQSQHVDRHENMGSGHETESCDVEEEDKEVKGQDSKREVLPEHVDLEHTKPADHYFNVVSHGYDSKAASGTAAATSIQQPNQSTNKIGEENSKLVSMMHTDEEPQPYMYLFKFHASVSQSTIDGRRNPSRACAIISMLFAQKFNKSPSTFPTEGPIWTVPDRVFRQVEDAIREGNASHEANYDGKLVDLGPEEVIMLTKDLGVECVYQTDVDTRELDKLVPEVMQIKPKQAIMFIKNYRVVSLVPCNHNNSHLLLFDSHPHFVMTEQVRKMYGAYLFYVVKKAAVVKDLFMYNDIFCDPKPFYAKLVIFNC